VAIVTEGWPATPLGTGGRMLGTVPRTQATGASSFLFYDLMAVVALGVLLLGGFLAQASTIAQIILTGIAVMATDVRMLPAIMLLQCTFTDFKGGIGAGMEGQYERFEAITIYIAGFPVTPGYALTLAVAVRVLFGMFTETGRLNRAMPLLLLVPWVPAFVIGTINSFASFQERFPGWSANIREELQFFALWYGVLLAMQSNASANLKTTLRTRLALICIVALSLNFCSLFTNRFTWLLMALGGVVGLQSILVRADRNLLLAVPLLTLSLFHAVGIKATSGARAAATAAAGGYSSTLTTLLIFLGSVVLGLLLYRRGSAVQAALLPSFSRVKTVMLAAVTFAGFIAVPFIVAPTTVGLSIDMETDTDRQTYRERFLHKLLLERASLWRGGIEQIMEPPYVFKLRNPLNYFITPSEKRVYVMFNSHNMVLDSLRTQGWLVGGVTIFFLFVCFYVALATYFRCRFPEPIAIVAILAIATNLGSGIAGGAMSEAGLSFFVMSFAGMCAVYNLLPSRSASLAGRRGAVSPDRLPADHVTLST
jgi:hypothetical protein